MSQKQNRNKKKHHFNLPIETPAFVLSCVFLLNWIELGHEIHCFGALAQCTTSVSESQCVRARTAKKTQRRGICEKTERQNCARLAVLPLCEIKHCDVMCCCCSFPEKRGSIDAGKHVAGDRGDHNSNSTRLQSVLHRRLPVWPKLSCVCFKNIPVRTVLLLG